LITKSGAFYTVPGKKDKVQGKEKFAELLQSDPVLVKSLNTDIQKLIKDMRAGKKVLEDDALAAVPASGKKGKAVEVDAITDDMLGEDV
jgi:hypothetical protein